jgi:hypothetical protein
MSTQTIFFVAIAVFVLMMTGIALTTREFRKLQEDFSVGKDREIRR